MRRARRGRPLACGLAALVALVAAGPGLAGSGAVMMQSAALACGDGGGGIYVSCANGTVTDNRTGLIWLANASCFDQLSWQEAMTVVSGLGDLPGPACVGMDPDACDCGLSDGSSPGEWRLPTMAELEAVIVHASDVDACQPRVLNDVGNGCWEQGCFGNGSCSFYDVQAALYWTASSCPARPGEAWIGDLFTGLSYPLPSTQVAFIWPVRGSQ